MIPRRNHPEIWISENLFPHQYLLCQIVWNHVARWVLGTHNSTCSVCLCCTALLPSQCLASRRVRRLTYRVYYLGAPVYTLKKTTTTNRYHPVVQDIPTVTSRSRTPPSPPPSPSFAWWWWWWPLCRRITVTSRQVGLQAKRTTNMIQRDQKIMTSLQAILLYTYFLAGSYVFKGASS